MRKLATKLSVSALAVAVLAISGIAIAQQTPKPETLIKWRQSVFQVIAWNSGRIKANVDGQYNKDDVIRSANAIAALSKAGLGSLFAPGTEQGKGWHDTAARAEVFKDTSHFDELGAAFSKEANELATVALTGDQAAVKTQFGKLQRSCKSCHDDFKSRD